VAESRRTRVVVPPAFPHGRQNIDTDGGVQANGTGIYGAKVGGSAPSSIAVKIRGRKRVPVSGKSRSRGRG